MIDREGEQICIAAWNHYGEFHQTDRLIEEMAELTQAIVKARVAGVGIKSKPVVEEFVDVSVCMKQLELILIDEGYSSQIEEVTKYKLERLYKRMKYEK